MSQTISHTVSAASQHEEFDYRPVPVLAPVSLVLGLCSAIALFAAFGVIIAFIGAVLGGICLLKIRRANGTLGGGLLSMSGLVLSSIFFVSGIGVHSYSYATELPEGYIRVNFPNDISRKQFVIENGRRQIHPDVKPLVDQKIFLKGYMWNRGKENGLTAFVLLKDNGKCCFGGDPAAWDMILVMMEPGETVDYILGLVSVGGTLRANPNAGFGAAVYTIEAPHFERARTSF